MAITTSAAYQVQELYTGYIQEAFDVDLNLMSSGIITSTADISAAAHGEGHWASVRYYGNVDATINVQDESTDKAVPNKVDSSLMKAIKSARDTSWQVGDLSKLLSNENGLTQSALQAAQNRSKNEQSELLLSAFGVLSDNVANDSGDAVVSIVKLDSGASTSANNVSRNAIIDTIVKLEGDASDFIGVVNWATFGDLAKLDTGTFVDRTSDNTIFSGSFMGIDLIVNNQLTDTSGTAAGDEDTSILGNIAADATADNKVIRTIYFYRKGGFAYAPTTMPTPVAVQRDEFTGKGSGDTTVFYRWGHVLHPLGYAYTGTDTGFVTDTLLSAPGSWDRKWNNIRTQAVGALVYNG